MATDKTLTLNEGRKGNLAYPICTVATQPALFYWGIA